MELLSRWKDKLCKKKVKRNNQQEQILKSMKIDILTEGGTINVSRYVTIPDYVIVFVERIKRMGYKVEYKGEDTESLYLVIKYTPFRYFSRDTTLDLKLTISAVKLNNKKHLEMLTEYIKHSYAIKKLL